MNEPHDDTNEQVSPEAAPEVAAAAGDAPETLRLPRWKIALYSAVTAVVVFFICNAIASWYLRRFHGYDGEHLYQYVFDAYKNILPTPNYVDTRGVRHNSQGFRRSEDVSRSKPEGTIRIFLMGGSTAYGLGGLWPHIDPNYPVLDNRNTIDAYLERDLNAAYGDQARFEVINAAITSTWTHHELIYLNQTILGYDPDMILMLDGFNDFFNRGAGHDQFGSYSYNLQSRIVMGEPTLYSLAYGIGWWAFRRNELAHVTGRGLRLFKLLLTPKPEQPPMDVERNMTALREAFPHNALTMQRRIGLILDDADVDAVFMMQPMLILDREKPMPEIERALFQFNVDSYLPNYEQFAARAVEYFRGEEAQMAADVGAEFIDLTRVFDHADEQMFTDYVHLTPKANEIMARVIEKRIAPLIRQRLGDDRPTS